MTGTLVIVRVVMVERHLDNATWHLVICPHGGQDTTHQVVPSHPSDTMDLL